MSALAQIPRLALQASATSIAPLAILSTRAFSSTIPKLFDSEKSDKLAPATTPSQVQPSNGSFKSFAQYRLLIVQKDPLTMQTRRNFVSSSGKPVVKETDVASQRLRDMAKKVAYRESESIKSSDL